MSGSAQTLPPPTRVVQPGVSVAAQALESFARKIDAHVNRPVTSLRNHLLGQAFQILRSCSQPGWDGEGAVPVKPEAVQAAANFIVRLPNAAAAPDIVPEVAGTIALEWRRAKDRILVVSLTGKNTLVYAGILGAGEDVHGTKPFVGSIPREVQELILDYFS